MSDDERVLRSFVGEDERLRGLWSLRKVERGRSFMPPGPASEETVAVTDDRVLWFRGELDEVSLAAVEETDYEFVERQAAPPMVLGASLLFVLGIFGSIGAFIAGVGDTLVVAMPALTGLLLVLGAHVFTSATGREGERRAGHRLQLSVAGDSVSLWGPDEETMTEVEAAIGGESVDAAEGEVTTQDSPDDEPAGDATDDEPADDAGSAASDEEAN